MNFQVTIECSNVARQNIAEQCRRAGVEYSLFHRRISMKNPPHHVLHAARGEADKQYRAIQALGRQYEPKTAPRAVA